MPATTNKQRVLAHLFTALKKRYNPLEPEPRPVLEQLLYAILREGTTRKEADDAFRALQDRFFDWNEIRVSSPRELEEVLADLPHSEARAQRIIGLLQEVFETTFSFDLETLHKKGLKQAAKQLGRYQSMNDYAISWVIQQSLGGHAVPLDDAGMRVLRRLGLLDGEPGEPGDMETLRAGLEHLIPKSRGPLFHELVSALANDLCHEDEPRCAHCPMCQECPTGQESGRPAVALERAGRPKSR
jgi:endonuclease-3